MKKATKYTGLASLFCFLGAFLLFFGTTIISVVLNIALTANEYDGDIGWYGAGGTTITPFWSFMRRIVMPLFQIGIPILLIMAALVLFIIFIIFLITSKSKQEV